MSDCPKPSTEQEAKNKLSAASALQRILNANVCSKDIQYELHADGSASYSVMDGTGDVDGHLTHDAIMSEEGCGAISAAIASYNEAKSQLACIMTKVS